MGSKVHIHHATGASFKKGARPTPRHLLAAATPHRPRAGLTPPAYYFQIPLQFSMWGNGPDPNWPDRDGDGNCVSVGEALNKALAGIFISDATLYKWCVKNDTLNGADLSPVIQQMHAAGFVQDGNVYGDGSPQAVNYANWGSLVAAIYEAGTNANSGPGNPTGGSVKCGVAADELPQGAGNNNGWFMLTNSPDSNEDHNMEAFGYGTAQQFCDAMNAAFPGLGLTVPAGSDPTTLGVAMYTWNTIGFVAFKAFTNFVGEVWIRMPSSVNTGAGSPSPDKVVVWQPQTPTPIPVPPSPPPPVPPTPVPSPSGWTGTIPVINGALQAPVAATGNRISVAQALAVILNAQ